MLSISMMSIGKIVIRKIFTLQSKLGLFPDYEPASALIVGQQNTLLSLASIDSFWVHGGNSLAMYP